MSNEQNTDADRGPRPGWKQLIALLAFLGIGGSLIYVLQVPSAVRWIVFGTILAIAGAAFLTGGVVGLLFGVPRTVRTSGQPTEERYESNTNLEQVSDWLTKIIIGVGLVQIGHAGPILTKLGETLKAPLGGQPSSAAFGLALTIFYTLLGFLLYYLWARTSFQVELRTTFRGSRRKTNQNNS
jgi:hypothetical protein